MSGRVSYLGGIVKDGLVLDLDAGKLDSYNRLGTTWNDVSGNGNNGTLTNFDSNKWSSDSGGALIFDGTDSYVNLSDVPFRITNYNFTLECTFYFDGTNQVRSLLSKRNPNSPFNSFGVFLGNGNVYSPSVGNKLSVFIRDDNNPNNNSSNDRAIVYTLSSAGIYHAIVTHDSTSVKLWVNGVASSEAASGSFGGGSVPTATSNLFSGNLTIAGWNFRIGNNNASSYWAEKVYMCRFYNRVLSSSEVLQNYNSVKSRFNI